MYEGYPKRVACAPGIDKLLLRRTYTNNDESSPNRDLIAQEAKMQSPWNTVYCRVLLAILPFAISGCTFHTQPYVAYSDARHPLSDTAVFSTQGLKGNTLGQIVGVDGKGTACAQVGCPAWVRVTPGDHLFRIRYRILSLSLKGEGEFPVTGMRARHVYEANFRTDEKQTEVRADAKDLGENPDYGMWVGLKGVNQKYHRVSFGD